MALRLPFAVLTHPDCTSPAHSRSVGQATAFAMPRGPLKGPRGPLKGPRGPLKGLKNPKNPFKGLKNPKKSS